MDFKKIAKELFWADEKFQSFLSKYAKTSEGGDFFL